MQRALRMSALSDNKQKYLPSFQLNWLLFGKQKAKEAILSLAHVCRIELCEIV